MLKNFFPCVVVCVRDYTTASTHKRKILEGKSVCKKNKFAEVFFLMFAKYYDKKHNITKKRSYDKVDFIYKHTHTHSLVN